MSRDPYIESLKAEIERLKKGQDPWDSLASVTRHIPELTMAVILAWEAGELSEGRAVELTGIDRLKLRAMRMQIVEAVSALAKSCKLPLTSAMEATLERQRLSKTEPGRGAAERS